MTHVLIVKMSSLGDVVHTLPALTDASHYLPGVKFDWVVEEGFQEIPAWHQSVHTVIPIAQRRWRKQPIKAYHHGEYQAFWKALRAKRYDLVIDAQGLLKSAVVTRMARGKRAGLQWHDARESLASLFYQRKCAVSQSAHAVHRVRALFAAALQYELPVSSADYGINRDTLPQINLPARPYFMFLHGTTWATKHWPERYWATLAQQAVIDGYDVCLPWGNTHERDRAMRIAGDSKHITVLPKLSLSEISAYIAQATGVVAVDTGLGHIAAALGAPTISLYGPTDPKHTGTVGNNQLHLNTGFECAPCLKRSCPFSDSRKKMPVCFSALSPHLVWQKCQSHLDTVSS